LLPFRRVLLPRGFRRVLGVDDRLYIGRWRNKTPQTDA
jgi:hypothetical protein